MLERLKTTRDGNDSKSNAVTAASVAAAASVPLASNSGRTPDSYPTKAVPSIASSVVNNGDGATATEEDTLPWCFAGYALKKSGSTFVGLQTRFFVLSDDGTIDYFQSVCKVNLFY